MTSRHCPDPRHHRNRRHLLVDVITLSVCGIIVGCDGPTAIEDWAKAGKDWLQQFLELPNGIPSRDCIRRVLTTLKLEAFQQCFESWFARLICEGVGPLRLIAADGKTLRRSHDAKNGLGPLHRVSAWASDNGLSLGQIATDGKSNEITAIPELLGRIDVKGTLVTIDAMGCQKDIAQKIVDAGGDYVPAVKDNQPKLRAAIEEYFSDERRAEPAKSPRRKHETSEQSHGRQEERHDVLAKLSKDFPLKNRNSSAACNDGDGVNRHCIAPLALRWYARAHAGVAIESQCGPRAH